MSEYRQVGSIALYDAGVIIKDNDYEHPFHDFGFGTYEIFGHDLHKIFEALGFETFQIGVHPNRTRLQHETFEMFGPKVSIYGDDFSKEGKVAKVEVKIDGPQMLSVKITENWGGEIFEREITYCGRFSIYWI